MIVFDTTTLSMIWISGATVNSRKTGKPIKHAKERINALIERIATDDDVIIIPAPVLSEVIVKIPNKADELVKRIKSSPWFKVEAFDAAAAIELGLRTAQAISAGDKREGLQADWTKVKFDRQIVSIAMVANATEIISDDRDIAAICERWNFPVRSIEDLPIPSELIPPPLFAKLEEEEDEPKMPEGPDAQPTPVQRSSEGYPEGEAGTEETKVEPSEASKPEAKTVAQPNPNPDEAKPRESK